MKPRLAAALGAAVVLSAAIAAVMVLEPLFGPAGDVAPPPGVASASGVEATPAPGPQYYRTRDLDVRPGIKVRVEPEYPEAAARRFLSGKVRIRLLIDEAGAVERVDVLSADPPGYFESSAQRAFGAARFSPGMKDGRAVKVQLMLEVAFDGPPPPGAVTR